MPIMLRGASIAINFKKVMISGPRPFARKKITY